MKIMRYYEIKALSPILPVNRGRYQINSGFNLSNCRGEIIVLLGSRVSSSAWLHKLFLEQQTSVKQALAGSFAPPSSNQEFKNNPINLSPLQSLYAQIYQVTRLYNTHLGLLDVKALTEQYITAAGLQAYRDLSPLQVPGIVLQQTKLALRFAIGHDMVLLDNLFDMLNTNDKALLHISLQNLQDSETKPRTIIYATQNLEDALYMADRILIMNPVKIGTIAENVPVMVDRPRNKQLLKYLPAYKSLRKRLHYLLTDALAVEDNLLLS